MTHFFKNHWWLTFCRRHACVNYQFPHPSISFLFFSSPPSPFPVVTFFLLFFFSSSSFSPMSEQTEPDESTQIFFSPWFQFVLQNEIERERREESEIEQETEESEIELQRGVLLSDMRFFYGEMKLFFSDQLFLPFLFSVVLQSKTGEQEN